MTAKQFYEDSLINGMHYLPLGVIALKEENLYTLMEAYAEKAFKAAREYAGHNIFLYDGVVDYFNNNPI